MQGLDQLLVGEPLVFHFDVAFFAGADVLLNFLFQFSKRFERLEKAKGQSLDEINKVARETEDS